LIILNISIITSGNLDIDNIKPSGLSVLDNITHSILPNEADTSINETDHNTDSHKHIGIPKFNKHMINLVCMLELKMARLSYKSLFHVIDLFYEKIERSQHKLKKQRAKEVEMSFINFIFLLILTFYKYYFYII